PRRGEGRAVGAAGDDRHLARRTGRPGAAAGARPDRRARRRGDPQRPSRRDPDHRGPLCDPHRRQHHGVPGRAGGADQRAPPRRGAARHGHRRRDPDRARPRDPRRRPRRAAGPAGRPRPRAARDDRAGHPAGRHRGRPQRAPDRLRGAGPPAAEEADVVSEIRVVLVDDQHLVRAGLRALLERAPDITVVGEAGDGATGLAVVRTHRPDVVLMDVRMPGTDGLQATRQILADPALGAVQVIMLTTFDDDEYLFEAIRAGAAGFLLKDTAPDALRDAVRVVAGGGALLSPAVTRRVLAAAARSTAARPER